MICVTKLSKSLTSDWQFPDPEIQRVSRTAFRPVFQLKFGQFWAELCVQRTRIGVRKCSGRSLAPMVSQGPRSKQHASLPRTSAIQRPPSSSFEHFSMTRWVLTYCDPCLVMLTQTPAIREEASTYRHTRLARLVCAGLPLGNLSGTPAHAPTSS